MSKLKQKLTNLPKKKSDEGLTESELKSLNREVILKWYRNKRNKKLEELKGEITAADLSRQQEIRENIIKETSKNLRKLNKDLPKTERDRIAENFTDRFFEAIDADDFNKELDTLSSIEAEQRMFFLFLGMQGGVKGLENFKKFKSNKVLQAMFKSEPSLEAEYDKIAEEGDMDALTDFLIKHDKTGTFEKIGKKKLYFTLSMFNNEQSPIGAMLDKVPLVGDFMGQVFKWAKKTKEFANFPFFLKAAKKLDVKMFNLMNLSNMTLSELRVRVGIFKRYRHLLDKMLENTTSKTKERRIKRQIGYIEDSEKVLKIMQDLRDNHEFAIKQALGRILDTKYKKLDEIDKERIMAEINLDAMKVQSFLPIAVYGPEGIIKNDSNLFWMGEMMLRWKRMKHGFRFITGRDYKEYSHSRALFSVANMRRKERATRNFKKNIRYIDKHNQLAPMIDDFQRKVNGYNVAAAGEKSASTFAEDMNRHDNLVRQYQVLSHKMSEVMSKEANNLVGAGAEIDKLRMAEGKVKVSNLSESTRKTLGLKHVGETIEINDLKAIYTKKLVELNEIKTSIQTRFGHLSNDVATNVIKKFDDRWITRSGIKQVGEQVADVQQTVNRYLKPQNRAFRKAKMLALPGIAVGVPIIDLVRGKARAGEVMGDVFDVAIGFVPVAGTVNDFKQMWTGRTTSGRKLSKLERVGAGVFCAIGAISDVALVFGGAGYAIRAGFGSLRVGKGIAKVGKFARSTRGLAHEVEEVGVFQRAYAKIAARGIRRTEEGVSIVAKGDIYEYMSLSRKMKKYGGLSDSKDLARYNHLMKTAGHDVQYFEKAKQSLGIPEDISNVGLSLRKFFTKGKIGNLKKSFTPAEFKQIQQASKEMGNYDDLMASRKIWLGKLEQSRTITDPKAKAILRKEATENIADIERRLGAITEIQNKVFAKTEKLAQRSLVLNKVAKWAGRGGLAFSGVMLLSQISPSANQVVKEAGSAAVGTADLAWKGTKWTFATAADYRTPPNPIDEMIYDYVNEKKETLEFLEKVKKVEKSKAEARQKKLQIEAICAAYWQNAQVRAWAYKHKKKLSIRGILENIKKKMLSVRNQFVPGGKPLRPANMELYRGGGTNRGVSLEKK